LPAVPGKQVGYEDVFTRLALCRRHFQVAGFEAEIIERLIR
jgi:hypothetical protein